ncbi:hypothetical protein OEZ85_010101 [Tetradesmus obliquus]|uniref:Uncharacterized protein n=1 Tax=Tetradesmus obliquus TaxID=3088 RepID=A0ABY8TNB4_TETOB|nr:hypothetical protein OEZ85_010101 [Tetradesmus obliquus]
MLQHRSGRTSRALAKQGGSSGWRGAQPAAGPAACGGARLAQVAGARSQVEVCCSAALGSRWARAQPAAHQHGLQYICKVVARFL